MKSIRKYMIYLSFTYWEKIPLFSTSDESHKYLKNIFLQNPKLIKDSQKDNDLNIKEVEERINQQLIFLYKNNNEDQSDERDNNSNNKDEYLLDLKIIKLMIQVKKK